MRFWLVVIALLTGLFFFTRPQPKPVDELLRASQNRSLVEFGDGAVWVVSHTSDDGPDSFDVEMLPGAGWKRSTLNEMVAKGAKRVVSKDEYDYRLLAAKFLNQ